VKNFTWYQLPLLVWAVFIFILSSFKTFPHIETPIIAADKLAHVSIYFVFCWFSRRALFFQTGSSFLKRWSLPSAFFLTCLYGYLDEVHQLFVPGRTYDYFDMLADAVGAILFVIIYLLAKRQKESKTSLQGCRHKDGGTESKV
jgi:VanZ family protein